MLMTARAGLTYVDGAEADTKLPYRTYMTSTELPALDRKVDEQVEKKISSGVNETARKSLHKIFKFSWLAGNTFTQRSSLLSTCWSLSTCMSSQ